MKSLRESSLEIFSTCPQAVHHSADEYAQRVAEVSRWSDEAGFEGMLIYTDNSQADPWIVSHIVLQSTEHLCPLVAVQPIYMHPYTAAKMVATYSHLCQRRIYLNMLAGGFKNDLISLDDDTPHDDRYVRTTEYTLIIRRILEANGSPVNFEGKYYNVKNLKMQPTLSPELFPGILISGSSAAGRQAAEDIGATAVKYPKPPEEEEAPFETAGFKAGVRVGVIARDSNDEAWRIGLERFPEDRKGQLTHQLAMRISDSEWHQQLSEMEEKPSERNPYWLGPFKNYRTFCPYLVGDYDRVAQVIHEYLVLGYRTFIIDIPPSEEDVQHTARAFQMAYAMLS